MANEAYVKSQRCKLLFSECIKVFVFLIFIFLLVCLFVHLFVCFSAFSLRNGAKCWQMLFINCINVMPSRATTRDRWRYQLRHFERLIFTFTVPLLWHVTQLKLVLSMAWNCIWWWGFILGVWGMWNTSSLPLLSGPLWFEGVMPVRVLSISQIKLFNYLQRIVVVWHHTAKCKLFVLDRNTWLVELLEINSNTWNYLTVYKQMNS